MPRIDEGKGTSCNQMKPNVLLVDDDQDVLITNKMGLERYARLFSVLTAEDGQNALKMLKSHPVSLVVTDLKMPRLDGFGLLAQILEHYPDIPVLIMTGNSTPSLKQKADQKGAVGFIEKPFTFETLARKIVPLLRRASEGGALHGFSIGTFVQVVEMEQKTCTIRVSNRDTDQQGILFFLDGELMDARIDGKTGVDAAYIVLSWENVSLSIQNVCPKKEKAIADDLQKVLLEAMRRKDDSIGSDEDSVDV